MRSRRTAPFAPVVDVVDGEAAHDEVDGPERRDRVPEVPVAHLDVWLVREALARRGQHGWRDVDRYDPLDRRSLLEHQRGETTVATPEVEGRAR